MTQKDTLRRKLRTTQDTPKDAPLVITQKLQAIIDHLPYCQTIGLYIAMDHEPDITSLIAQNPTKIFALPKVINDEMVFVQYELSDSLEHNNKFPLLQEPIHSKILLPDLLIIPGLAFDLQGYRLGMGMGHYDRYLSKNHNPKTIGVCFNKNLLESLPYEAHDCKMNFLVTENFIIRL